MTLEATFMILIASVLMFGALALGRRVLKRVRWRPRVRPRPRPIPPEWHPILERNAPFLRFLSRDDRTRLLELTRQFVAKKHFEGCNGLTITDEIKVTIAAHACFPVLNLGLDYYDRLATILVYPTTFVPKHGVWTRGGAAESTHDPTYGESWHGGFVVLAWDNVLEGVRDPTDGVNVVLHEFAHQLDQRDGESDGLPAFHTPTATTALEAVLAEELTVLRAAVDLGQETVLDPYGAEDEAEFFAVATEAFFETPDLLHHAHPRLYEQLRFYFRQDPIHRLPGHGD